MLYLTRKLGESVIINDEITMTLIDVKGRTAKLGFTFPPSATVLRQELYERIQQENLQASELSSDLFKGFQLGLGSGTVRAQPNPLSADATPAAPPSPNATKPTLSLKPSVAKALADDAPLSDAPPMDSHDPA
ncbi:MAG: carbon storage regulator [Alphaproteobacteria bacterium]|nr:carbon storage regulator [Alphaproteobacteria bacterium]